MEFKKFFIGALVFVPVFGFAASNSSLPSVNPIAPANTFPIYDLEDFDSPETIILELSSIGSQGPNPLDGYIQENCTNIINHQWGYMAINDDSSNGVTDFFQFRVVPNGGGFATLIMHTQANFNLNSFCMTPAGYASPVCTSGVDMIKVHRAAPASNLIYEVYFDSSDPMNLEVCAVKMDNSPVSVWFKGGVNARETNQEISDLKVQPNPFNDLLEVNLPETEVENDVVITLYDLLGRQMMNETFPGGQGSYTITTNDIPPGSYVLQAQSGLIRTTTKVVKTQ
ncbi:MAG: T9SS type A sorting domain-containing protein [Saprospiraceae bacterium]|nr:T9SS type A sorting domain-containing protein [Saprospiraceae bacterium]